MYSNNHLEPTISGLTRHTSIISPPGTPMAPEFPTDPILAPDCSGCGIRLSYMRYVCQTCGEAHMWKENETMKITNGVASEAGDSDESVETHLATRPDHNHAESSLYGTPRPRSISTSTHESHDSVRTATNNRHHGDLHAPSESGLGYELCPSCIEVRGLEHSRTAAMVARHRMPPGDWARRGGELRHTFREKVWGSHGWQDVGMSPSNSPVYCRCASC